MPAEPTITVVFGVGNVFSSNSLSPFRGLSRRFLVRHILKIGRNPVRCNCLPSLGQLDLTSGEAREAGEALCKIL